MWDAWLQWDSMIKTMGWLMVDEYRLMFGSPITIADLSIKQYTLGELVEIGMEYYQQTISFVVFEPEDFIKKKTLSKEELNQISLYDLVCFIPNLNRWCTQMLNMFLGGEWQYKGQFLHFVRYNESEETFDIVEKEKFTLIIEFLKKAYCISKPKKDYDSDKATSEDVLNMLAEFEEVKRQSVSKKTITLGSIIESVATRHGSYNFFNIWGLTVFQLMSTYYRMEHISNYENIMHSIYGGVLSSKEIKIEEIHWANKTTD